MRSVFDCSLYELNKSHDPEGNLTFIYENVHVPFPINRVFYSYDIPGGEDRGAHAHKECHQFIIAASGSFEVVLDNVLYYLIVHFGGCMCRREYGRQNKVFHRVVSAWY